MLESLIALLGSAPIANALGSGLSHLGNRFFPGFKRGSKVNDAITEADAEFAKKTRLEQLEHAKKSRLPLPGELLQLSDEHNTLNIEAVSTKIAEDKIRQEARTEAQEETIEQLRIKLAAAFNGKNYEAALVLSEMLQQYIIITSDIYSNLDYIRITSLAEIFFSETTADKKRECYKQLSVYVEKYFTICDFSALFNYGLANLKMLSIAERQETPLFIERAKKSFEKALDFNLNIDFTLNNLAVVLKYSERSANTPEERAQILQEAINHLEEAKNVAPQNHKIFSNLGDIYMRLAEISSADVMRQGNFLKLALQAYSECLGLSRSFPLIMDKANALFSLGKIEQDSNAKDRLFQDAISFYNDAYIIAPSRTDAAYACLKMAQVYDTGRTLEALPQEQKDSLLFSGVRCYLTALEHVPFYASLQYETARLLLNIAKFGEFDIPSFKKIAQPQVLTISQAGQKGQKSVRQKQASREVAQATDRAMSAIKINLLEFSYRYFRDAMYLMPENPQAAVLYGESSVYWAFLQKKQGNQQKAEVELNSVTQLLDKADQLKSSSASYVRACLHAVKGETELCNDRLKEALENCVCPPRSQVAREPYFSGYAKTPWFNDILETIPERPVGDLYSAALFSDSGASA